MKKMKMKKTIMKKMKMKKTIMKKTKIILVESKPGG